MARTRQPSNLLGLVDSDSEDDLGGPVKRAPATSTAAKSKAASKTATIRDMPAATRRGRPSAASKASTTTANKVAKPAAKKTATTAATRRAAARRTSAVEAAVEEDETTEETATVKTTKPRGRRVLADRTNEQTAEAESSGKAAKGGRGRKAAQAKETDEEEAAEEPSEVEEGPEAKRQGRGRGRPKSTATKEESEKPKATATRRKAGRAAATTTEPEADESMAVDEDEGQEEESHAEPEPADSMEIDHGDDDEIAADDTTADKTQDAVAAPSLPSPAAQRSRTKTQPPSSAVKRSVGAGASSSEDAIAVRRRLGDLTKKYDALEARYRDLREIGIKEAERNFDRLKKEGEDRVTASDQLIASLKSELATYRKLADDGANAQRECDANEARAAALQKQVEQLTASLGEAKAESKGLATKVAALRTVTEQHQQVPGSATKKGGASGSASSAAASAAAAAVALGQQAQLKEDLYGDLTGLLVRSARRDGSGELYDCIQTGRNGSLHFKLAIDTKGEYGETTYDDAQFVYTPQLDASRDAVLISRLPDYLVEEISFPRVQAAKFYKRVMQSLAEEV